MSAKIANIKLNNGVEIPIIGAQSLLVLYLCITPEKNPGSGSWAPPTPEAQAGVTAWILTAFKVSICYRMQAAMSLSRLAEWLPPHRHCASLWYESYSIYNRLVVVADAV